jgi:hypothetical protein
MFYTGMLTLLATVYGFGEQMCGNVDNAVSCEYGRLTASGSVFDPLTPSVAVFAEPNRRIRKNTFICIRHLQSNSKVWLPVTDKHYKKGRVDLSPSAVVKLGGKVSHYWSNEVNLCGEKSSWYQINGLQSYLSNGMWTTI